jgi:hypothetical protein
MKRRLPLQLRLKISPHRWAGLENRRVTQRLHHRLCLEHAAAMQNPSFPQIKQENRQQDDDA